MDDIARDLADPTINREPRTPCVLLLDTSGSMGEKVQINGRSVLPINELNAGLRTFVEVLQKDSKARAALDLSIVTFGDLPSLVQDWTPLDGYAAPTFSATGLTPLGGALTRGLDLVRTRSRWYQKHSLLCHRPWMVIVTDGKPTDTAFEQAAADTLEAQTRKDVTVFAITTDSSPDTVALLQKVTKRVLILNDMDYSEFFNWLSTSMRTISASQVGARIDVPKPANPEKLSAYDDV